MFCLCDENEQSAVVNFRVFSFILSGNVKEKYITMLRSGAILRRGASASCAGIWRGGQSRLRAAAAYSTSSGKESIGKSATTAAASKKMSSRTIPLTWASLGATALLGIVGLDYYAKEKARLDAEREAKARKVKTYGKPLLGGPWTLTDHTGKTVTNESIQPSYALLYFGFTACPEICPTELKKMKAIIEKLDRHADVGEGRVQPVFISVDPKRDTVERVSKYIKGYHPRMIGLTGTPKQVEDICKSFRVYHSIAKDNENENDNDYLVDHSIVMYLMGPDSVFIDFFTQLTEADEAVERIAAHVVQKDAELANASPSDGVAQE